MKSPLLVCDAGPVIILAKLGVLTKWIAALGYQPILLHVVLDEVNRGSFAYGEKDELEKFLSQAKVVPSAEIKEPQVSLSVQDQASLLYAEKHAPAILLADDRLLRRAARQAGVPVIGFPGILIQALQEQLVSKEEALQLLDQAIQRHQYRISITLYQGMRKKIEDM